MKTVYSLLLASFLISCSEPTSTETSDENKSMGGKLDGEFVHMVFFWLKEDIDVQAFMDGTEQFLKEVDVVRSYHLGTPAMTPREVVDNSYSVSLVVTFDSKEDQDIYQQHPAHLDYVAEMSDSWTTVKVFDSLSKK